MTQNEWHRLVVQAEECLSKRKFTDAGKLYEQAAEEAGKVQQSAPELWLQAARAYEGSRATEAAVKCYVEASQFFTGTEKAQCLLNCWNLYIVSIAGYQWDCCFEWHGDDHHDDDHDLNKQLIQETSQKAENLLRQALTVEGADEEKIIRLAMEECHKRKKQGRWGESACWNMITAVTGRKKGFFHA